MGPPLWRQEIIDTAKEASDKVHFGADVTVVPWTAAAADGGMRWKARGFCIGKMVAK